MASREASDGGPERSSRLDAMGQTVASSDEVASAETVASFDEVASAETVASSDEVASAETVASFDEVASAATVAGDSAQTPTLAATQPPDTLPPSEGPLSQQPRRFGKLEVLERLGAGGMGEVLAAWDPDLSRKVAVKVLRAGPGGAAAQDRLLREAQAMAQLSHPNVITVHQVGSRGDQVYVVMEYVDGGTLREWLAREQRDWRAVIGLYRAAGVGLAAAHALGLVHRDFKPDNVLVHRDGRALVTDFGLVASTQLGARAPGSTASQALPPQSTPSSSKLALRLTQTGEVMGTPYYMAPEQHAGERADERADQFAFCAALFEALYGTRPFAGESYRELMANVMRGKPLPPPEGTKVPDWIYGVLTRGLRVDPDQRYADMPTLLAALGRDPQQARRRWLLGGATLAALAALGVIGVLLLGGGPAARCARGAEDALARVWTEARRAAVLARTAGESGKRLVGLVDGYADRWRRQRQAACEATQVTGEQSSSLLDRRMLCLDRRLGRLSALLARLDGGARARELAPAALEAVRRLPSLAACRDREQMLAGVLPPPGSRAAVARLSKVLDEVSAAESLGSDYAEAQGKAKQALVEAKKVGYRPLTARAHYLVGQLAVRRGEHALAERQYREAVGLATRARAHRLEAEIWLSLIYLVGHTTLRPRPALAMAPAAEAAVTRAGDDPVLRGRLASNLGLIMMSKGDYKEALGELKRSLAIFIKASGARHLDTATVRNNLAMLLERLGRHEEARAELLKVLAAREHALGRRHPSVATALNDLGNTAHSMERHQEAKGYLERALAIREATLGKNHQRTGHTLNNLAIVLGELGQTTQAVALARRAVAVGERAFGKNHPELAGALNTLGQQLRAQGERKAAWQAFARALAIVEHARGREHVTLAPMLENLARILSELGLHPRALAFVDRAIAVRQRAAGKDHPSVINALGLRGSFNLEGEQATAAVADFERQRALAKSRHGEGHAEVGLAEYNRAVALEQAGRLADAGRGYRMAAALLARVAPRHVALVNAIRGEGDVAAARKNRRAAAVHYRRALALAKQIGADVTKLQELLSSVTR